jgi:hypothetical protein
MRSPYCLCVYVSPPPQFFFFCAACVLSNESRPLVLPRTLITIGFIFPICYSMKQSKILSKYIIFIEFSLIIYVSNSN